MTISKETAKGIVEEYLAVESNETEIELVVIDKETQEFDFGWVFFYDSKAHVESGNDRDMIAGNAPLILDRRDGAIHVTGTADPIEHYVDNYVKHGSPYSKDH